MQMCVCACSVVFDFLQSMDYSLPGSSVHGIFQARILDCVPKSFSSGSSLPRDQSWSPALQADSLPTELPGKAC